MKKFIISTALCLAFGALIATAQVTPTTPVWALSNVFVIDGGTLAYTNISTGARPVDIPQSKVISLFAHWGGSSILVNTGAVGIAWALRGDGTNYSNATNQWLWQLVYPTGTGPVFAATNFDAHLLTGFDKMKVVQITNNTLSSTAAVMRITNIWIGLP